MTGGLPARLWLGRDHGGPVPVWTDAGTLGADDLAALGVPAAVVERLEEWNDRVWPVWGARVPRPVEPGWDREDQLWDVEIHYYGDDLPGPVRGRRR